MFGIGKTLSDPFGVNERRDRQHVQDMHEIEKRALEDQLESARDTSNMGVAIVGAMLGQERQRSAELTNQLAIEHGEAIDQTALWVGARAVIIAMSTVMDEIVAGRTKATDHRGLLFDKDRAGKHVTANKTRRKIFVEAVREFEKEILSGEFPRSDVSAGIVSAQRLVDNIEAMLADGKYIEAPGGSSI